MAYLVFDYLLFLLDSKDFCTFANEMHLRTTKHITFVAISTALFSVLCSCNGTKFVTDNQLLLIGNRVESTDPNVSVRGLSEYIKQKPNSKWFSLIKLPLGIYSLAGRDTTKSINRRLKAWGEAPVIVDSAQVIQSCQNIAIAMQNNGYLEAEVYPRIDSKNKRAITTYMVTPGKRYLVGNISYDIADKRIDSLLVANALLGQYLKSGEPFTLTMLHNERNNITAWLNNHGYYFFNKEAITYQADSTAAKHSVDLTLRIGLYRRASHEDLRPHPYYTIRNVSYLPGNGQEKLNLRNSILKTNTFITEGKEYSANDVQQTYRKFSRLQAIQATNIRLTEVIDSSRQDSLQLDANIQLTRRKLHSIQVQPEGTNTSGDFGAALSLTYENRNLFHGSEKFTLQARGAFEAIRGLEGYENSNFQEYSIEGKLSFPKFLLPGISSNFQKRHTATSEVAISYNWQNRPEFHRRVLTGAWRYRWASSSSRVNYRFDLLDLNFISMPWISDTFMNKYIYGETNNAFLRYNYEDLFIMKTGFGITYSDKSNNLRLNIETAGNLLDGLANIFHFPIDEEEEGEPYLVAHVAFAQYAKFDADYTHYFQLDQRNKLALHARLGIAVPYGNSTQLPFEKRFFAGGANSVRGWSVRTLGPGRFISQDNKADIINQTGDIKIDLSAELRTKLFWKFEGALFVDAGNIWTLHSNDYEQPGGSFTIKSLWEEMAVAYGLGLRLNFDLFVLRLDLGMKAINPAYTTNKEHFPIAHMNFSRDYALHFAVGMPF